MQNDKHSETKIKLANKFMECLEYKNINQITITYLVNKCKINRKTFYYHFKDIFDLLEFSIYNDLLCKINDYENSDNNIAIFVNYIYENKVKILHIINFVKIDDIKLYFNNNISTILEKYLKEIITKNSYKISNDFLNHLITYLTSIVASTIYTCLIKLNDNNKDIIINNTSFIFKTAINAILEKANNTK